MESLKDIAEDKDEAKVNFYQDWNHLLKQDPTKEDDRAMRSVTSVEERSAIQDNSNLQSQSQEPTDVLEKQSVEAKPVLRQQSVVRQRWRSVSKSIRKTNLVSLQDGKPLLIIFPHPKNHTFGLESLMATMDISAEDLKVDKEKLKEAAANAASNWELILQRMLPSEEAKEPSHSLHEVFGIDENTFKAFNMFKLLKKLPIIHEKKTDLINALKDAVRTRNENCFINPNNTYKTEEVLMSCAQMRVLERNSTRILERLLPLRAVELNAAIEALFKKDQVHKMSATYNVLHGIRLHQHGCIAETSPG